MIERPLLYSFRRCPYAMRARMALAVSGVACQLMEVSLRAKPPALLAASPKATVPVLVLPGGAVIDESLAIMHWALAQHDPEGWLAGDEAHTAVWIGDNDGPFKHALDRYKYPTRFPDADPVAQRSAAVTILARWDAVLAHQPFLSGATRQLVDIALFPFVRQFAATDAAWFAAQPLPGVQRWLAGLTSSALFAAVMAKPARAAHNA